MKSYISCCIFFLLLFSSKAFSQDFLKGKGGIYNFKDRQYQLSPYQDAPPRDSFGFIMEAGLEKNLSSYPKFLDLRKFHTPVKDQGSRGSCAYFSAAALAENAIKKYQGDEVNISEEYLIKLGKGLFGRFAGDDGSVAYYNLFDLKEGFGLEKDFPYQYNWFKRGLPCQNYDEKDPNTPAACFSHLAPTKEEQEMAIPFEGLEIVSLEPSAENIAAWMASYDQSVIVGLPVNKKGWNGETGYVTHNEQLRQECLKNKDLCGGHSIVLTGYNLRNRTFTFKNSWGKDWGQNGYGTIPFGYINSYMQGNPVVAYLTQKVDLPSNHQTSLPSPTFNNLKYSLNTNDGDGRFLTLNLFGNIKHRSNHIISISSTFTYNDYGEEGYPNVVPVPPKYKKRYGKFLSDSFHENFRTRNEINMDEEPLSLSIPYALISRRILNNKDMALRLRISYFSDTEGFIRVLDQYIPLN
ncbi:MAG: C1 family peptidase [Bdellovibrionota bacterium]|nr:C1 family peptidase [Bdellovibrionota bacterium]